MNSCSRILLLSLTLCLTDSASLWAQKTLAEGISDLASQISARAVQKKKIAVLPFRELDGRATVLGTYLAEELITDLFNLGGPEIVERAMVDRLLGEIKLGQTGLVDPETAKKIGKLSGVDAVVTGTITDLKSYIAINCRLIDTQTGTIFAAAKINIVQDDSLRTVLGSLLGKERPAGEDSSKQEGATEKGKPRELPTLETESYRLTVESVRRVGDTVILQIRAEAVLGRSVEFNAGGWYLLDENGDRWDDRDAHIRQRQGETFYRSVELLSGTSVRGELTFAATAGSSGRRFTLAAREYKPNYGREIVIRGLQAQ
jgi:TolB-like protein